MACQFRMAYSATGCNISLPFVRPIRYVNWGGGAKQERGVITWNHSSHNAYLHTAHHWKTWNQCTAASLLGLNASLFRATDRHWWWVIMVVLWFFHCKQSIWQEVMKIKANRLTRVDTTGLPIWGPRNNLPLRLKNGVNGRYSSTLLSVEFVHSNCSSFI